MTNCIGANISANSINYFRYFLSSLVVMNKQKHKFERLTYDRLNIWSFEWLKVWKTFHVLLSWVHILTVNGGRKLLKTPNIKVLFITISEHSLLQTLLQQIGHQRHPQQILRSYSALSFDRDPLQATISGPVSICHIIEAANPSLAPILEQRTFPLVSLSISRFRYSICQ